MEDNVHPVIRLLAARKEAHPEEFAMVMQDGWTIPQYSDTNIWARELRTLEPYMTEAEKSLLFSSYRELTFNKIMGTVMRKLLDGASYGG